MLIVVGLFDLSFWMTYNLVAMTATKILHTQGDVVDAFGGPSKFAARFRTARTAPYNYRKGIPLPPRLLFAVVAACGIDGYQLGPSLSQRIDPEVISGISAYHLSRPRGQ